MSTPCSFCLEIRSKTDVAPPAKLSFGTLGQRQRKKTGDKSLTRDSFFRGEVLCFSVFDFKFQYWISVYKKRVSPAKSLGEVVGGGGCGRAWGWINYGFLYSPHLMFSIIFVSVMHLHNHLCTSISPKILKEMFA